MGGVILLAENLFSGGIGGQFAGHTISAEEEPAGFEAWRVGNGRRSSLDKAMATTANSSWWIRSVFDRVRAHNCIVIDRGHNLAGKTFELRSTLDATDFTGTFETPFDITMPSVAIPNTNIDNGAGARTEESAWIKRYPTRTAKAVEVFIDAMGASLKPEIVGLWVGLAIELEYAKLEFDDDASDLLAVQMESESGWIGRARRTRRRRGRLVVDLMSFTEYEGQVRYQIAGLFADGAPLWIVQDENQAERAVLTLNGQPGTSVPFPSDPYPYRRLDISFVEHSPKPF